MTNLMAEPAALLSAVVTILALLFYFYAGMRVGSMRSKHGIKAPLMTGHPEMDRAVRIHMNTLEQLVIFLPLLWLATIYFHLVAWLPAAVGIVWIIGRFLYMTSYMADPDKRGTGFGIALLANVVLLVLAVWGIAVTWSAAAAS